MHWLNWHTHSPTILIYHQLLLFDMSVIIESENSVLVLYLKDGFGSILFLWLRPRILRKFWHFLPQMDRKFLDFWPRKTYSPSSYGPLSIWSIQHVKLWCCTGNRQASSGISTQSWCKCKAILGRIRFDESESGFRLDSVNLSIQWANPNLDSWISESSFDVDSLAKPEVTSVSQM